MGIIMRKIGGCSNGPVEGSLRDSLITIRQAHVQLHLMARQKITPTVIASQIELCDVLLGEISEIRSCLANDLRHTQRRPQDIASHMA